MRSKLLTTIVSLITVLLMMTGCTQMVRHSNTLVFGTNTTWGVGVGQGADQTPKIDIGYNRQEVAMVPLFANTEADEGNLNPCGSSTSAPSATTTSTATTSSVPESSLIRDCMFVASNGGKDKDSYSTIASFGGKTGTDATSGTVEVAIAQYFATGVAAQQLVLSGGANVVQAGGNTKAKADAAGVAAGAKLAAEMLEDIEIGQIAARTIMGAKTDSVDPAKLQELATNMPGRGAACTDTELANLDQTNVGNFLADLEKAKPVCLRRLANHVAE